MTTFLINFLIPFQLCIATNGAYAPVNLYPEAINACYAVIGRSLYPSYDSNVIIPF